jgi:hypothetical protein
MSYAITWEQNGDWLTRSVKSFNEGQWQADEKFWELHRAGVRHPHVTLHHEPDGMEALDTDAATR